MALLFAERNLHRITGFINVEGNLAPEDCMFSRNVIPHSYRHFEQVIFPQIKKAVSARRGRGFAQHLGVWQEQIHEYIMITRFRPWNTLIAATCCSGFFRFRFQNAFCMARKTATFPTCNDCGSPTARSSKYPMRTISCSTMHRMTTQQLWHHLLGILRRLKKESLPRSQFLVSTAGENRRYALQRRFFQADDRNGIIFVPEILI